MVKCLHLAVGRASPSGLDAAPGRKPCAPPSRPSRSWRHGGYFSLSAFQFLSVSVVLLSCCPLHLALCALKQRGSRHQEAQTLVGRAVFAPFASWRLFQLISFSVFKCVRCPLSCCPPRLALCALKQRGSRRQKAQIKVGRDSPSGLDAAPGRKPCAPPSRSLRSWRHGGYFSLSAFQFLSVSVVRCPVVLRAWRSAL
jgi:hypothetical protein